MKADIVKRNLNKLREAGYKVESITLCDNRQGIKVDSNYDGAYPTKEAFNILDTMRKAYGKKYTVEPRGHYTAIFIY